MSTDLQSIELLVIHVARESDFFYFLGRGRSLKKKKNPSHFWAHYEVRVI